MDYTDQEKVVITEDILRTVAGCAYCESCAELARMYLATVGGELNSSGELIHSENNKEESI